MSTTPPPLDGNTAAGVLSEVFSADVTAAIGQCAGCGGRAPLGEAGLYLQAPGVVLRCRGCDLVLARVVTTPAGRWLDLRGLAVLRI
jgi:Family of unknown function (DUF6510)